MQIYIHIPFCKQKCAYCDFNSFPDHSDDWVFKYLTTLNHEIQLAAKQFGKAVITTAYIGGGTPSLLSEKQISGIVHALETGFDFHPKEFTIECNPESITEEKLKTYRDLGISRISIGVQSLDDRNLRSIGRLHDSKRAIDSLKLAAKYFDNISADLIVGLPYDTEETVASEVDRLAPMVDHLSIYQLSVEEGTPLSKRVQDGTVWLPDDDETALLFDIAVQELKCNVSDNSANSDSFDDRGGFERYEISNFAKGGKVSEHNTGYWKREEYLGFGAGAHSFLKTSDGAKPLANQLRFASPKPILAYMASVESAKEYMDIPRVDHEVLTIDDEKSEAVMLGLRLAEGIDGALLEGKDLTRVNEFLMRKEGRIALNHAGMSVMNAVLAEIL